MRALISNAIVVLALATLAAGCGDDPVQATPDAGEQTDGGIDPDGGSPADGGETDGGVTPEVGDPIVAPAEAWTWVDFPDAVCGNGSPTGIGINPTSDSTDVFIYMQGGGACWDAFTCFTLRSAPRVITGYSRTDFDSATEKGMFAVDRAEPANPFKDMSYVFIPYCTGDVHAGDAVQQYGSNPEVHHKGARNVAAFLSRLVPTFPNAMRIFLAGSSGGAFGAQLNYERVASAFPNAEVHVFADSGQMINPVPQFLSAWLPAWNVTLPAGCSGCDTDFSLYPQHLASTYSDRRFALTAYYEDEVLRSFFGYIQLFGRTGADFVAATEALLTNRYDPYPNAKYFALTGDFTLTGAQTTHTMLGSLDTLAAPSGMTLNEFTTAFVTGSADWSSVKPSP